MGADQGPPRAAFRGCGEEGWRAPSALPAATRCDGRYGLILDAVHTDQRPGGTRGGEGAYKGGFTEGRVPTQCWTGRPAGARIPFKGAAYLWPIRLPSPLDLALWHYAVCAGGFGAAKRGGGEPLSAGAREKGAARCGRVFRLAVSMCYGFVVRPCMGVQFHHAMVARTCGQGGGPRRAAVEPVGTVRERGVEPVGRQRSRAWSPWARRRSTSRSPWAGRNAGRGAIGVG
jgi:hypothetical protein